MEKIRIKVEEIFVGLRGLASHEKDQYLHGKPIGHLTLGASPCGGACSVQQRRVFYCGSDNTDHDRLC
jgi:hypothetical protein